jgi:2-phosphoglycerate kinase
MVSIERASDDVKESMNESDAENIGTEVVRELNKLGIDKIESAKLKKIIVDAIYELGFARIAERYLKGTKE